MERNKKPSILVWGKGMEDAIAATSKERQPFARLGGIRKGFKSRTPTKERDMDQYAKLGDYDDAITSPFKAHTGELAPSKATCNKALKLNLTNVGYHEEEPCPSNLIILSVLSSN